MRACKAAGGGFHRHTRPSHCHRLQLSHRPRRRSPALCRPAAYPARGRAPHDIARSLQFLLGAIAILQVGGTFASLVTVWPTGGLWACLREGACTYGGAPRVLVAL